MRLTAHLYIRLPLLISIVLGVVCFFLLPTQLGTLQRVLIGWNTLAWPYLVFIWIRMLITDVSGIQRIARLQDQSAMLVLTIVIVACAASIVAILSELSALKELSGTPRVVHLLLTVTTLIVSWALVPSSFAMHYAHQHYLHRTQEVTPMIFPEKPEEPGYWDFLYYALRLRWPHKPPMWPPGQPGSGKSRCYNRLSPSCSISQYWVCRSTSAQVC